MKAERRDKLRETERFKQEKKRPESSVGVALRDLAFQRRSEDYQEVVELLSILQKRKLEGEDLFTEDFEAIDIAQAYLREVKEPDHKTLSN